MAGKGKTDADSLGLSYRARRRWALVILLIGLPAYIVTAITIVGWLNRPSFLVELAVYVGLGVVWALPFRAIFRGIGQHDPDRPEADGADAADTARSADRRDQPPR
ncbi:DUF2842 domain-containing protein [Brevirhabdus sp.]|uniref:DUF2842 domain-containing protein n=1 Tax=Brevirhabdus sp. TaxID=2004514 RepID=UPI004057CC26